MNTISRITDRDLLALMPKLVLTERASSADVIEHLVEIDRRRLYLEQACRSLSCFCTERLGYSEDETARRVRVARLTKKFPGVLAELRNGTVHLTGLALLAPVMTDENCESLLAQARGKSKREIEQLIAELFPKPDVPEVVLPVAGQLAAQALLGAAAGELAGAKIGSGPTLAPHSGVSGVENTTPTSVRPLSASSWSVQFTAGRGFIEKLERATELLSHALPDGKVAQVLERALDALIELERKRKLGSGSSRKRRPLKAGSRRVPVDVARVVWERDAGQCAFVDDQGRRCSARRFVTIEHRHPYALGGPPTEENLCLLCKAHNIRSARKVFGEAYIAACSKRSRREQGNGACEAPAPSADSSAAGEAPAPSADSSAAGETQTVGEIASGRDEPLAKVRAGLRTLGFRESEVQRALSFLCRKTEIPRVPESLLRAALEVLVPRTAP